MPCGLKNSMYFNKMLVATKERRKDGIAYSSTLPLRTNRKEIKWLKPFTWRPPMIVKQPEPKKTKLQGQRQRWGRCEPARGSHFSLGVFATERGAGGRQKAQATHRRQRKQQSFWLTPQVGLTGIRDLGNRPSEKERLENWAQGSDDFLLKTLAGLQDYLDVDYGKVKWKRKPLKIREVLGPFPSVDETPGMRDPAVGTDPRSLPLECWRATVWEQRPWVLNNEPNCHLDSGAKRWPHCPDYLGS